MNKNNYAPGAARTAEPQKTEQFLRDASYRVDYKSEGVFLGVTYEEGGGAVLLPDCVAFDMDRRKITGLNTVDMIIRIRKKENYIKLAPPQEKLPFDMNFSVRLGREEMTAYMMLFPPSEEGAILTPEKVLSEIKEKWGVTYGLNEKAVTDAVQNRRYYQTITIAEGREPQKGKDGFVTFLFKTEHSYALKQLEDGSADYKNLNIFESVSENDAVAVLVPAELGIDGYTVKGRAINAQKGKEAVLPKGKNVKISEDGQSLLAAKNGRVDFVNGKVEVSDIFKIKGDVDMSVGNIDFAGDLIIEGNVNSGFILTATGNIEVHGFVDASVLTAGKDIILKNGFQGNEKGALKAGGNIVARFIERGAVEAAGSLFADYIVHCTVTVGGNIAMKGKHGKIIGGIVRAGREIIATSVGSTSGEYTSLEVGVSPELRVNLAELETKRIQQKSQMDKLDNITRVMPAASTESQERLLMRQRLADTREQLAQAYAQMQKDIEDLKIRLSELSGGRVHIFGKVYSDVRITVDSSFYTVKSAMEHLTFKYRDGEVVFTSCEIKNN